MTKNSVIAVILILLVCIASGYALQQRTVSLPDATEATSTIETLQKTEDQVPTTTFITDSVEPVQATNTPQASYEGVHIMPDGKVMAKDGSIIANATIRSDGKIEMSDGIVVTPAMDLRSKTVKSDAVTKTPAHIISNITGVDYAYDIKQIKVKKGDTVTINFKSDSGFHDLVIDALRVATKRVNEGEGVTSVTFVADTVGTFQYYCTVMSHRQMGMVGYLIVE